MTNERFLEKGRGYASSISLSEMSFMYRSQRSPVTCVMVSMRVTLSSSRREREVYLATGEATDGDDHFGGRNGVVSFQCILASTPDAL